MREFEFDMSPRNAADGRGVVSPDGIPMVLGGVIFSRHRYWIFEAWCG